MNRILVSEFKKNMSTEEKKTSVEEFSEQQSAELESLKQKIKVYKRIMHYNHKRKPPITYRAGIKKY